MGSQEFVVVRHLGRMFGEGHPYMCEYMEELVESRRHLETQEKSGCGNPHVDSPQNGNSGDESVCSTLPFHSSPLLLTAVSPPATRSSNSLPGTCAKSFESSSSPLAIRNK